MNTPADATHGGPVEKLVQLRRRDPHRYTRWRVGTLVGVHVLAAIHIAHWKLAGRTLAPLELNEVLHTVHAGIVTAGFLLMAVAIVATAIFGRFFCSWGCHLLALQDLAAWLLAKLHIRARPIRSRALVLIAPAALLYLFAWPEVERWLAGRPHPPLAIHGAGQGWESFVTNDFWRNLPEVGIALTTLFVCGFAIVYLLGSRSLCHYACPYGVVFRAADHVAPGRIVRRGECPPGCGACTAVCQSQVRVHEEIGKLGMIANGRCLKDLDCVAACPSGVLRYEMVRPPALRKLPALAPRRYDLSFGEEALASIVCLGSVLALRGLYDTVPFLLALGLGAAMAVLALGALRIATRRGDVKVGAVHARRGGRLTPGGALFATVTLASGALVTHSAFTRAHEWLGTRAIERAIAVAQDGGRPAPSDIASAHVHVAWCQRWGLIAPVAATRRLAAFHETRATTLLRDGDASGALRELREALALEERRASVHIALGALYARRGALEGAATHLRRAVALAPDSSTAWNDLGVVLGRLDHPDDALAAHRAAVRVGPRDAAAHANLGVSLANAGQLDDARTHLQRALALDPNDVGARQALAAIGASRAVVH